MTDIDAIRQDIDDVIADIEDDLDIKPPIQPGDLRMSHFEEKWKISTNACKGRLLKVSPEKGRLLLVQVRPGVRATVWRPYPPPTA